MHHLDALILGLEHLKALYTDDEDFKGLFLACLKHPKVIS